MKTNKTEEKKCEQVCRGIHILHGEHCQKEQPEQERHIDGPLMKQCDAWLEKYFKENEYPLDFDDVTWIMHDFVRSLTTYPPQELRQEGEWEKHVAPSPTLEKKLMCILGECPVSQENHLFEGFGEYCKFKGLTRVSEKFGELKILIKEIEQKARDDERKRCAEIIKYERDTCLEHRQENEYLEWTSTMNHAENKILNKPTP